MMSEENKIFSYKTGTNTSIFNQNGEDWALIGLVSDNHLFSLTILSNVSFIIGIHRLNFFLYLVLRKTRIHNNHLNFIKVLTKLL